MNNSSFVIAIAARQSSINIWIAARFVLAMTIATLLAACKPLNNPYPRHDDTANIYYSSFTTPPKTLDPARSYVTNEALFTGQVYEPPLQYDYLKRPYQLIPLTAAKMPEALYDPITDRTTYTVTIKKGIRYQPHPALVSGPAEPLGDKRTLSEFAKQGTRELVAADYVYQIKRLAREHSPIFSLMSKYIVGLKKLREQLPEDDTHWIDLRNYPLAGARVLDRYRYQVIIKGKYPQFRYWLAMAFFAPVPWEADQFYHQPGMADHNLSFDWYPIGTGPYMLTENNPNQRMVLEKNPNFHGEYYPGTKKPLPLINKFVFSLEKESIPRWHKFLQGYYDASGISADSFDQAITFAAGGEAQLTDAMKAKAIRLQTGIRPVIFYLGFNMLDPIVGGQSVRARKLRQAISIAIDYEEYIHIFANGRGVIAQGPIPPGVFGYQAGESGVNPYVYDWQDGRAKRQSIEKAKQLLAEAGYSNGLLLHFDTPASGSPDEKAYFTWLRKQFAKIGIELNIRATQYNRYQEKMRHGNGQIFSLGWAADYPDPENFLFLLYGPNGKVKHGGENTVNYNNENFNHLFEKMKTLPNTPERAAIIKHMLSIVQRDAPWVWGYYPKEFQLTHTWVGPYTINEMANNTLKYLSLDPKARAKFRQQWNQPILWPLFLALFLLILGAFWAHHHYRKIQTKTSL